MGYRVEVEPIIAQAVRRRIGQVVRLPALAALLLASFSIAFSIAVSSAVAAISPDLPGGGPVLGAATSGPNATPVRADVRLIALRGGTGSTELDVLSGYLRSTPPAESADVFAVTVAASVPHARGAERHQQGRAPPHTR